MTESAKQAAVLSAALAIFARDGYSRASIDVIAAEAGVSTRTIYNHFAGKEALFRAVIEASAARVAQAQIALIATHFDQVGDGELATALNAFGRAWARSANDHRPHFALVRQINADEGHIAQATLDSWQRIGPRQVRGELARRLRDLGERGLLTVDDPELAAAHLMLLTATAVSNAEAFRPRPLPRREVERIVAAGVRTFLHGSGPVPAQ